MNPSDHLRVLRAQQRLSQMEVAAELGCGHNRYWRIENGFQVPTDDEVKKLEKLLKVPLAGVFPQVAA